MTIEILLLRSAAKKPAGKRLWPENFISELRESSGLEFANELTDNLVRLMMIKLERDGLCELEMVEVVSETGVPFVAIRNVTPKGLDLIRQIESAP